MTISEQTVTEASAIQRTQQRGSLLIHACLFLLFYLLLVAVSPLPGLHMSASPLPEAWSWTLLPFHLLFTVIGPLLSASHDRAWLGYLLLSITLLGLLGTYAWSIITILRRRNESRTSRRWLFLLLGGALLFGLILLLQPMLFSDDVFTYIFSGRILIVYGADPLNTAPLQFPTDPYLHWVVSGRAAPNIYGPLWLCVASLLVRIGGGPATTLLLFKGVALFAHLLNSVLVWLILDRVAPTRRLLGTLLYAWNPLALIELAGSGHSEGILLMLLLLATWLIVQREGYWHRSGALLVFGLAISTNFITLLIASLYIWFAVRTERRIPRALWSCCWRASIMLAPALLISLPFWRGASTFFAVTSAMDMQHFIHSPVGTLAEPMRLFFQWVAAWLHFPSFLQPVIAADVALRASATFIFTLIYIDLFSKVRRAPITYAQNTSAEMDARLNAHQEMKLPGFDILLSSWGNAVFWYMVLVSGWFWPWYLLWLLWIVVLRRFDAFTSMVLVLSGTALFLYPSLEFNRSPIALYLPALIFGLPLVYLIIIKSRKRYFERITVTYER